MFVHVCKVFLSRAQCPEIHLLYHRGTVLCVIGFYYYYYSPWTEITGFYFLSLNMLFLLCFRFLKIYFRGKRIWPTFTLYKMSTFLFAPFCSANFVLLLLLWHQMWGIRQRSWGKFNVLKVMPLKIYTKIYLSPQPPVLYSNLVYY